MADIDMALPSERELELETLLRQREKQISALTDEISSLRQKLPGASDPEDDAVISIPAPVLALLSPLVTHGPSTGTPAPLSNAITQRLKLLQTENDELYELLRSSAEARIAELNSKLDHGRIPLAKSVTQQEQHRRSSTPDQRRSASPPRRLVPASSRPRERSREHDRDRERDRERERDRDRDRERERERDRDRDWDRDRERDRDRDRGNLPTGPRAHKKPRLGPSEGGGRKPGEGPGGNGQRSVSGRNGAGGGGRGGPPRAGGPGLPIRGSATSASSTGQNGNAGQGGDRGLVQRLGL
ncbi:pre-mRNA-splicing factor 38-associated hydrophilic carboxy-terminal protein [Rhizoctonia solani]|uniref:Pre-mRNA-splicing factor 38-associated hydrophilic carboxy-terminal protein n=1 Tax=Rhizoctonia solani TaxID=456999 RepID=A0A8H8SSC2_9AGAM|nr:pre-mRNA-splicing factor 38-associated hydrophilic carboxy-terminal protein [Rhizoctonia solani]QRW16434.1 pre-mRNA-splicing factor 38-associated hydrophilic carboxy-terminal protein [Rhizoctonia solani]